MARQSLIIPPNNGQYADIDIASQHCLCLLREIDKRKSFRTNIKSTETPLKCRGSQAAGRFLDIKELQYDVQDYREHRQASRIETLDGSLQSNSRKP